MGGWDSRRRDGGKNLSILDFLPIFLFLCSDLLLFNRLVTALFNCRNSFQCLFLSKRGKLFVLKWPFNIWLCEKYFPSAG